jgi:hypothetical protein
MWEKQTPRKIAIAEGRTRYFSGSPCPKGHVAERMVSTRACCGCLGEKSLSWRIANPEKVNEQKRNWRNANLEKARALNLANQKLHRESANKRQRKWLEANREQSNAASAAWAQANPGKCSARAARRRAAELRATPSWADQDAITGMYELAQVFRRTGMLVEVDHAIPLQSRKVSGLHVADNLQLIHSLANKSKSNSFAI